MTEVEGSGSVAYTEDFEDGSQILGSNKAIDEELTGELTLNEEKVAEDSTIPISEELMEPASIDMTANESVQKTIEEEVVEEKKEIVPEPMPIV
jgi:hypothetical protein